MKNVIKMVMLYCSHAKYRKMLSTSRREPSIADHAQNAREEVLLMSILHIEYILFSFIAHGRTFPMFVVALAAEKNR